MAPHHSNFYYSFYRRIFNALIVCVKDKMVKQEKVMEFIEDELKDFISIEGDEDGVCLRRVNDFDGWEGEDLFGIVKICLEKANGGTT